MDLNYLLSRYQISMMRAEGAATREAAIAHRGLARGYAARIREMQIDLGAKPSLVTAT